MKIVLYWFKWLTVLVIACVSISTNASAVEDRKFGLGFAAGAPSGLNAKIWLSHRNALDITFGWGYWNYWVKADYIWHDWSVIEETEDLRIPVYYGIGGFAGGLKEETGFGPEAVIGLNIILNKSPFDFFVEAGPAFQLVRAPGLYIHASFGARYFF